MANENYIRWQANTIAQLGNCINILLVLGMAIFGFYFDAIISKKFGVLGCETYLLRAGLTFIGFSILFGVAAHFTRVLDFRKTSKIASLSENDQDAKLIESFRISAKNLGKITWGFVWSQLMVFCTGIILLIIFTLVALP
jgi:hypothetical protein